MALLDNGLRGNLITGLAIGIGAAILAPIVIPAVAAVAKPLAKAALKGGILLYDRGKEAVAEAGEVIEDLMAETKAEIAEARKEAVTVAESQSGTNG
jgi:hypothetical protein